MPHHPVKSSGKELLQLAAQTALIKRGVDGPKGIKA
jgi:hypothetical protein